VRKLERLGETITPGRGDPLSLVGIVVPGARGAAVRTQRGHVDGVPEEAWSAESSPKARTAPTLFRLVGLPNLLQSRAVTSNLACRSLGDPKERLCSFGG